MSNPEGDFRALAQVDEVNLAALPEIRFVEDSLAAEGHFARWTKAAAFATHRWTDAWIAIARSAGSRAVSLDADFSTFDDLRFLHLKP